MVEAIIILIGIVILGAIVGICIEFLLNLHDNSDLN